MVFFDGILFYKTCPGLGIGVCQILWSLIYSTSLNGAGPDKMVCKLEKRKGFTVSRFYLVLISPNDLSFPLKNIWKAKILPRVAFSWTAALGKILTICARELLGVLEWCYMCKGNGETVDRLLLHCLFALELWSMVFMLFSLYWVIPKSVFNLLAAWQGCFGNHRNGIIWKAVPHCVMWCIWRERHTRSFEDLERNLLDFKMFILRTLLDWISSLGCFSLSSIFNLMDLCTLWL